MGRIITSITIVNMLEPEHKIRCDALVDTGVSHLVLPSAWRERQGELQELGVIEVVLANQQAIQGVVCAPVKVQLEGFRPTVTEVLFVDMEQNDGEYEPLIGYIILEQSQAAVDMLGHRLVRVKYLDLK
ncbi:MAG: hypothetical protein FJY65_03400 [Calditrichaeota bacterium]|nr:hypothetical protein [Calditrichota bacterium]